MFDPHTHRKTIKHFHDPGDIHELTFSCYNRMPLLNNNCWRGHFTEAINRTMERVGVYLAAFVFMPEHAHLLFWGLESEVQVPALLGAIKRPTSVKVKRDLVAAKSPLLKRLTIRDRPGKTSFRYWQEGPGYDRNFFTPQAVQAAIDYIHDNPRRRGLCSKPQDWRWSSAKYYLVDAVQDPLLPLITPLPREFWLS